MKTTKKILLTVLMIVLSIPAVYAQKDYFNPPKADEKVLGVVKVEYIVNGLGEKLYYNYSCNWYKELLEKAERKFPNKSIDIRSMKLNLQVSDDWYCGPAEGIVVDLKDPEILAKKALSKAIDKALQNVRDGSRIAIDQIRVESGLNKEDFKDQVVEIVLDKGFKVVAKEYLERLYKEQQDQQSGIYDDRTTVKENNFSAVGYYLNVKQMETSVRVQVVNVSTGEYEGNITIKIQEY